MDKKSIQSVGANKGRILFVEDERSLVDMYHDYFEAKGYDFKFTKDVGEALLATESERPDAVLLDIIIPKEEKDGINLMAEQGYDYLAAVKKNSKTKDIPIVVLTNLNTDQDRKKCESMGAAAYIFKRDCAPGEVLEAVANIIDAHRGRK